MHEDVRSPSPDRAVMALVVPEPEWQPILHVSNQVVVYNPTSHALSIQHRESSESSRQPCPYCKQPLPPGFQPNDFEDQIEMDSDPAYDSRVTDYFKLLAIANETSSRPSSPPPLADPSQSRRGGAFPAEAMAEGYFKAFFQEEYKLGMGANGSVYLCQHMLDGNPLGHFAVKKIAVGESHTYLLRILREVRLLEQLRHPNIVTYHHAWLETCQFSSFGPKVPTLHVLMQWAEGGSLDDFIDVRLGRKTHQIHIDPLSPFGDSHVTSSPVSSPRTPTTPTAAPMESSSSGTGVHSRSARIRAFRALQKKPMEERERMRLDMKTSKAKNGAWTAVHLLSADEVRSLFKDIVEGLGFLHNKSILHLDLKPGNVLLTWDEGRLIPRAMLSDFGTSRDMVHNSRTRSGNTGTLEYTSPESLPSPHTGLLRQIDSKSDMWSLGMILHKLLFFKLPYRYASAGDANGDTVSTDREGDKLLQLEKEVLSYPGFKSTSALVSKFESRRLPRAFLILLESLLNVTPAGRPSCERVSTAIREGRLDPLREPVAPSSLIPIVRRRSTSDEPPARDPSTPQPDKLSQSEASGQATRPAAEVGEKTPLLGLPAPNDQTAISELRPPARRLRIAWTSWIRIVKSIILVLKVLSISSMCPDDRPRGVYPILIVFLALLDNCLEGLWISVGLGVIHIGLMTVCTQDRCCR
ncbi:kinase-like domain-containing protein [Infundibulicybe gibba]|nr:kinase-like domain-containing protein [Infundibulicybe gibba]